MKSVTGMVNLVIVINAEVQGGWIARGAVGVAGYERNVRIVMVMVVFARLAYVIAASAMAKVLFIRIVGVGISKQKERFILINLKVVQGVMALGKKKRRIMKHVRLAEVLERVARLLARTATVRERLLVRVVMERGVRNVRIVVARGR